MNQVKVLNSLSALDWLKYLKNCADEADNIARHYYESSAFKVAEKSDV